MTCPALTGGPGTTDSAGADAVELDEVELSAPEFLGRSWDEQYEVFRRLRRERPISHHAEPDIPGLPKGPGYWAITRYADVREISQRPEDFSSAGGVLSINDLPSGLEEFYGSLVSMDDPRHARLRRVVSGSFTPRMLRKIFADVERVAREVVDTALEKGDIDFVADLAAPFPLIVICDLMGVPASDRALVLQQANIILSGGDREYIPKGTDPVTAYLDAGGILADLFTDLARSRRRTPTEDLTSALVHSTVDGARLTEQELVSFFILLTVGGHETTRGALSYGMWSLHRNPDQWRIWAADPASVTPTAVEEIVRHSSPVAFMRRTATRMVTVGGHIFHQGEKVALYYGSANRDETVFTDPDTFDVRRSPNPHVGFGGHGPHFCLGAHLARHEIAILFREMLHRLPEVEVVGEPERLHSQFINGIRRLPVRLIPPSRRR